MQKTNKKHISLIRRTLAVIATLVMLLSMSLTAFADSRGRCLNYEGGIYYCAEETTAEELQNAQKGYNLLPEAVRNFCINKGVKFYVCKNPNAAAEPLAAGKTVSSGVWYDPSTMRLLETPTSYVEIYTARKKKRYDVIVHEVGHVLDFFYHFKDGYYKGRCYGISEIQDTVDIFNRYKDKLDKVDVTSPYNMGCAQECWAEMVRLLYTQPDELIAAGPELYYYTLHMVSEVVGGDATPYQMLTPESKEGFAYKVYADAYPDLKAAFGYNKDLLWKHYQECGKAEGRLAYFNPVTVAQTTGSYQNFDYKTYADTYPDLKAAFGYNKKKLWNHYQKYGKNEGRVAVFL